MTSLEARRKLIEGNTRYVVGKTLIKDLSEINRKNLDVNGQKPFALIVCCSDSRVPPEIIFDQGLGDIFVVRTAGNVIGEIELGSIEYGAEHLQIPLVVVLGHENCGAVKAAVEGGEIHGSLKHITDKIGISLRKILDKKDIYSACENENILDTVDEIKNNEIVKNLIRLGKLEVRGAKYGMQSGKVTFF